MTSPSHKIRAHPVIEGAGVRLNRVFSDDFARELDPFLLLDHFESDRAADFIKGFPWHPHRGIETLTYLLDGEIEHQDSLGHKGKIGKDEMQWMTAGGGIFHQEMPKGKRIKGFQLWVNLAKKDKMCLPKYRDIKDPPAIQTGDALIRIVSGRIGDTAGPVTDRDITYLDIALSGKFSYTLPDGMNGFAYVFEGTGSINGSEMVPKELVRVIDAVQMAGKMRLLLVAGHRLGEPIAWGGPIVMNTQDELENAFYDLENGTFIK